MAHVLAIEKLSKSYQGAGHTVRVLADLELQIEAGEFVAVQGPSGCGKSTLLLIAGGLLEPDSGRVQVADQDLYTLAPERRAGFRAARVGFVFQQFYLVPYLSVLDNVLVPSLATPVSDARQRAGELLDRLGLSPRVHHVPAELSAGEQQRTALARALLTRPALLLADEPTGNLDRDNAHAVLEQLADFARSGGAVLWATHDPEAGKYAGRLCRLRDGKLE